MDFEQQIILIIKKDFKSEGIHFHLFEFNKP